MFFNIYTLETQSSPQIHLSRNASTPQIHLSRNSSTISTPSPSPVKTRRSNLIRKYLKSPRAKRTKKDTHCLYCNSSVIGIDLENHLRSSQACGRNYQRYYKVKNLTAIVIKESNCLFCNIQGKIRLSIHLKKNIDCYTRYLAKFNVQNTEELMKILDTYKRQLCKQW